MTWSNDIVVGQFRDLQGVLEARSGSGILTRTRHLKKLAGSPATQDRHVMVGKSPNSSGHQLSDVHEVVGVAV